MKLMVLSQILVAIGYIGSDLTDMDIGMLNIGHDHSNDDHADVDNLDIHRKKQVEGKY